MADQVPTLSHNPASFADEVRANFDTPIWSVRVSAGAEAVDKRRITLQVIDRRSRDALGVYWAVLWLTATSGGIPDPTGNTVAFISADTVLGTIEPQAAWFIQTGVDGAAAFDLTITGAATRYVGSIIIGKAKESRAITWL